MENSDQHLPSQLSATPGKKRILTVDDCADLLSLNKDILEMEGYEVFTATSGADAFLALSKIAQPDLILLDMQMRDMSGPEFLLALEKVRPDIFSNVPVVFLSAMDKIPESKAAGSIRKPYEFAVFFEAVHRFIEIGTGRTRFDH